MKKDQYIGFGIVGTGMVADYHARAIDANKALGARLVAVCTRNPAKFREAADRFGVPCLDWDALCRDSNIDVICICTPSGCHAAQTIEAAGAGKHVVVEKPMALKLADADAMIEVCTSKERLLAVVLQRRAINVFRKISSAISARDIGEIIAGHIDVPYHRPQSYYDQADWRGTWSADGGGVLMNQAIHLVDLMVWYMGEPVEISATAMTCRHDIEVEDTLSARLRFENGAMGTILATTAAPPGFPHRVELYGTRGGIQIEGESVVRWRLADPGKAVITPIENPLPAEGGAGADPRGIDIEGHANIIRNVIMAMRSDTPLVVDGHEGRRSLAAVLDIYHAAGIGKQINHATTPA
jgi:UDP-N-acetyl-2-amino-2-deoxyglucuronate dehydrogenase